MKHIRILIRPFTVINVLPHLAITFTTPCRNSMPNYVDNLESRIHNVWSLIAPVGYVGLSVTCNYYIM